MTVVIDLDPEIEAGYAAEAAARGVSLPEYLRHVLQDQTAPMADKPISPEARAILWREAAKDLPDTPLLSDEAIRRESIYTPRG